jgi:hypothetical protein
LLAQFRLPGERMLIAAIVTAFLILHILAGVLLQHAAAKDPGAPQQEVGYSLYD